MSESLLAPSAFAVLLMTASCVSSSSAGAHVAPRSTTEPGSAALVSTDDLEPTTRPVPTPEQRYWLLRDEIEALAGSHPWVGHYESSGTDTHDEFLVAPRNGWVWSTRSVGGRRYRGAGTVREVGDWLAFDAAGCEPDPHAQRMRLPIRWGSRRYLLTASSIPYFLNLLNSGRERGSPSRALMTWGRENVPEGEPELPPGLAESRFVSPLCANVLHVEPAKADAQALNARVTLDVGRNRGVFVGMEFYLHAETPTYFGYVSVRAVDETTCSATCRGATALDPLEVGARMCSTRPERWATRP
ncbi:MAG: hypothetical protein L6Q99_12880 [Planctomycetes bacterium]|nr:hypothetical protein [Planctomycetota bacterium]